MGWTSFNKNPPKKVIPPPFLDVFEPVFFLTPFETKLLSVVVFPSSFLRRSSTMGAGASAETLANASFEEVAAGERAEGWLQEMGSSHPEPPEPKPRII